MSSPTSLDGKKWFASLPFHEAPCATCERYLGEGVCTAFPEGIPDAIFIDGKNNHREPVPGDGGLTYQKEA